MVMIFELYLEIISKKKFKSTLYFIYFLKGKSTLFSVKFVGKIPKKFTQILSSVYMKIKKEWNRNEWTIKKTISDYNVKIQQYFHGVHEETYRFRTWYT